EREIGEQGRRIERENDEIDERQSERRGTDELTERRHGSCTPRRAPYEAEAARSPCRSWSAAAKYARRSRWSADRNDSPRHFPAASCASRPGPRASSGIRAGGIRAAA